MMPRLGDRRIVPGRVGEAVVYEIATREPGRPVWMVEEFQDCTCPDCEAVGHWYRVGSWYETQADARAALRVRA